MDDFKEEDVIDIDENGNVKTGWKEKLKDFNEAAKQKAANVVEFCKNNQELAIIGGTLIVSMVKMTFRTIREANKGEEIYDDSNRTHIPIKRKLKASEIRELEWRMSHGESKVEALTYMGLTKD